MSGEPLKSEPVTGDSVPEKVSRELRVGHLLRIGTYLDYASRPHTLHWPSLSGDTRQVTALVRRLLRDGTGADRQRTALAEGGIQTVTDLIGVRSTVP